MSEIQPYVRQVPPSTASCTQMERRRFLAELKKQQRRGEISEVWTDAATERESRETGRFVVHYQRLREPRPRMPLYATLTAVALGGMVTVGVMAWHARYVILTGALVVLALWWAATRSNHGGICPGLHCSGCRGWRG